MRGASHGVADNAINSVPPHTGQDIHWRVWWGSYCRCICKQWCGCFIAQQRLQFQIAMPILSGHLLTEHALVHGRQRV